MTAFFIAAVKGRYPGNFILSLSKGPPLSGGTIGACAPQAHSNPLGDAT